MGTKLHGDHGGGKWGACTPSQPAPQVGEDGPRRRPGCWDTLSPRVRRTRHSVSPPGGKGLGSGGPACLGRPWSPDKADTLQNGKKS